MERTDKTVLREELGDIESRQAPRKKNIVVRRKKKLNIKRLLLVVGPIFAIILVYFLLSPKITLKGDGVIHLSYKDSYREEGATATFLGNNVTSSIVQKGKVEPGKVGEYKITYTVNRFIFHSTKTRTIKVVDEKSPTIELMGEKKVAICPGKKYKEEGYKALDDYDGDLTKKVERDEKKDRVLYTVFDSSKNKAEVERRLEYIDKEKPVVTLKGTNVVYANINGKYEELGYEATDNCDENLTGKVKVEGTVNTSKEGKYTITYTVKDTGGNETKVKRTVIVSKKTDPNSGESKPGVIYLTFDDGPLSGTTTDILNILKEEGVKGTFFITNGGPDSLVKRQFDEGHTVAIHTATHDFKKIYASEEAFFNDIKIVQDRIRRITGQETRILRFAGGSSNTISKKYNSGIMTRLSNQLFDQGYRYYDWNVDGNDAGACASKAASERKNCVYNYVTKNLSKSKPNIVLMHDIKGYTRDALRDIIRFGKQNGYTFEPITMNTAMIRQRINN